MAADLPRRALLALAAGAGIGQGPARAFDLRDKRWYEAAAAMRRLAESWGDQPYGAVLVLDGRIVGEGASRVVQRRDPDAHAERLAIADAQQRLARTQLAGSVLVSTSRPCSLCEAAAARAGVARMFHGEAMTDAGPPRA